MKISSYLFLIGILWSSLDGYGVSGDVLSEGLEFSGQWFVSYIVDNPGDAPSTNAFMLKRGYVTVQKWFNTSLTARVTQDIAVDHEGDGEGDIEIRLKYGYLRYTIQQQGLLTKPFIEFGLVHRPWLDYEQKINHYRVQGTMFLERIGMLRSADYGVTLGALFGGELEGGYRKAVNSAYPGRYGSFSVGIYNGGGYEAIERNNNKLIETRLSCRPFPCSLPGWQMSWINAFGKGNSTESPDYLLNSFFISYDSSFLTFTATAFSGSGNLEGSAVDAKGESYRHDGCSLFFELCLPFYHLCPVMRLDRWNGYENLQQDRYIAGLSCPFYKNSKILVDYEYLNIAEGTVKNRYEIYELAVEFSY